MAFTNIPDTDIAQDKPIKAETGLALRDNPLAIALGIPGSPQVQRAGIAAGAIDNSRIAGNTITKDRLLGGIVTSTWLNLGSSSASASLFGGSAEITMSELSFFPTITSNLSNGFTIESKPTASRGFKLVNKSGNVQTYTVSWRFIG